MLVRSAKRPDNAQNDPHRYTDAFLLILVSLAGGPKHGHAIIKDVEAFCGTRLAAGTVSDALARLAEAKYVFPVLPTDGIRRPYQLTRVGLYVAECQLRVMATIFCAGGPRIRVMKEKGALTPQPRDTAGTDTPQE